MKCPYCAEEIQDEAIFCRHCNHDFGLIKPLLARLIVAESGVKSLAEKQPVSIESSTFYHIFAVALTVALATFWTSGYFLVMFHGKVQTNNPYLYVLAIGMPPVVFGCLAGIAATRHRLRLYLPAGLTLGLLNLISIRTMLVGFPGDFQWRLAILSLLVGQSATFATFAWLASNLRNRSTGTLPPFESINSRLLLLASMLMAVASVLTTINRGLAWAKEFVQ